MYCCSNVAIEEQYYCSEGLLTLGQKNIYYQTRVSRLIRRVGSISKWPPYWLYYEIHACISHKQVRFACMKTYQVFLSASNSIRIVNICSSTAMQGSKLLEIQNAIFSFFFLAKSLRWVCHTTSCKAHLKRNTAGRRAVEIRIYTCTLKSMRKLVSTSRILPAVIFSWQVTNQIMQKSCYNATQAFAQPLCLLSNRKAGSISSAC